MAPSPIKREFLAEYVHGWGNALYLVRARSKEEVLERYPLFTVRDLEEATGITSEGLERLRMYPGPNRPTDIAVQDRSPEERQRFVVAQQRLWELAAKAISLDGLPGGTVEEVSQSRHWVDIDDDEDFRAEMHELWKDDTRYRELPPERRLK